jgi:hypothetical protein
MSTTPAPALSAAEAAEFAAVHRAQPPTAEDAFRRDTAADVGAVEVVVAWLAANGIKELLPETLSITVGRLDNMMIVERFRWKAGTRDTLDHVARRDGVEVVEPVLSCIREPFTPAIGRAMQAARVACMVLAEGPCPPLPPRPYVPATPTRPAMEERHAALHDEWLTPNGICEWLPEQATFVVDHAAQTITYDAFTWPDDRRGFHSNMIIKSDLDPTIVDTAPGTNDAVFERRTVPLVRSLSPRIRALFAESELTLVER